jgi:hypothetical protein
LTLQLLRFASPALPYFWGQLRNSGTGLSPLLQADDLRTFSVLRFPSLDTGSILTTKQLLELILVPGLSSFDTSTLKFIEHLLLRHLVKVITRSLGRRHLGRGLLRHRGQGRLLATATGQDLVGLTDDATFLIVALVASELSGPGHDPSFLIWSHSRLLGRGLDRGRSRGSFRSPRFTCFRRSLALVHLLELRLGDLR